MTAGVLTALRRNCGIVAGQAQLVRIAEEAVSAYAALLQSDESFQLQQDQACHHVGQGLDTLAFFVTLDSINFGSGYFPDIFGPSRSGYLALAAALKARFEHAGPIPPAELLRLKPLQTAALLRLDAANPAAAELSVHFTRALNDLGAFLLRTCGGEFAALVEAAAGSVERLIVLVRAMPLFDDVAPWGGRSIPFLKRAQLLAADLHIAFDGKGLGRFDDIDALTVMADNLVPHVLRCDGILHYRADLAARIDAGVPIPPASPEEIEIRAAAVHAGELIVADLRRRGQTVNAMLLDNLLWHRGQRPSYRARPRHRTRSVYY